MNEGMLSQFELAKRWNISDKTLLRWRCVGQGPRYLKIGKLVRYTLEDVEAFELRARRDCTAELSKVDVPGREVPPHDQSSGSVRKFNLREALAVPVKSQ